ncbi:MAG: flagellar basal body rod C-terminal domain-containing protein [Syntrophales bacterium]|jgi:flagellar hook protein FlgE
MSDTFNAALSTLGSLSREMDVTANNIANVKTNIFKVYINRVDTPGYVLPPDEKGKDQESSNVNLAEELVNPITTQHTYAKNIKTITTEDDMRKTLQDGIA